MTHRLFGRSTVFLALLFVVAAIGVWAARPAYAKEVRSAMLEIRGEATVAAPPGQQSQNCCAGHGAPTHVHPANTIIHNWWTQLQVKASWKRTVAIMKPLGLLVIKQKVGDSWYPGVGGGVGPSQSEVDQAMALNPDAFDWNLFTEVTEPNLTKGDSDYITVDAVLANVHDYCLKAWPKNPTTSSSGQVKCVDTSINSCNSANGLFQVGDEWPSGRKWERTNPDIEFRTYIRTDEVPVPTVYCGGTGKTVPLDFYIRYFHDSGLTSGLRIGKALTVSLDTGWFSSAQVFPPLNEDPLHVSLPCTPICSQYDGT